MDTFLADQTVSRIRNAAKFCDLQQHNVEHELLGLAIDYGKLLAEYAFGILIEKFGPPLGMGNASGITLGDRKLLWQTGEHGPQRTLWHAIMKEGWAEFRRCTLSRWASSERWWELSAGYDETNGWNCIGVDKGGSRIIIDIKSGLPEVSKIDFKCAPYTESKLLKLPVYAGIDAFVSGEAQRLLKNVELLPANWKVLDLFPIAYEYGYFLKTSFDHSMAQQGEERWNAHMEKGWRIFREEALKISRLDLWPKDLGPPDAAWWVVAIDGQRRVVMIDVHGGYPQTDLPNFNSNIRKWERRRRA